MNGALNKVIQESSRSWIFNTPSLIDGLHTVSAIIFLQDRRLAIQVQSVTDSYRKRISAIEQELIEEKDSEVINRLQSEKLELLARISNLETRLIQSRVAVGEVLNGTIFTQ